MFRPRERGSGVWSGLAAAGLSSEKVSTVKGSPCRFSSAVTASNRASLSEAAESVRTSATKSPGGGGAGAACVSATAASRVTRSMQNYGSAGPTWLRVFRPA